MKGFQPNIVQKYFPCSLCELKFPGPVLLRRHLQVKHDPGINKRKSSSTEPSGRDLKRKFENFADISNSDQVKNNVPNPGKKSTLHEKIENFKDSNQPLNEKAFEFTFNRKSEPAPAKDFQCDYCEYKASSLYGLNRHKTGHTGGKKCSKCNKGYSGASSSSEIYLKQHETSCDGKIKWLSATEGSQLESYPLKFENELENQNVPVLKTEYSKPPQLPIQPKKEVASMPPAMVPNKEILSRNTKFQAYISNQGMNVKSQGFEVKMKPAVAKDSYNVPQVAMDSYNVPQVAKDSYNVPPVAIDSYNVPQVAKDSYNEPKEHKEESSKEAIPQKETEKKTPQERTQFGTKGKRYEKYWCMGCKNWLNGGKGSVSGHLRRTHEKEDCHIIMITNQGMLKVSKEDFLPDRKT